jgi:GT2 family glycosyltransferase
MLPCYGDSPHLREAVASVLASHSDDWTLTLLDDGPADDALRAWVEGLDPRVTYRHNPTRLGINRNFQQCCDAADSPLVVVLGADDVLEPTYVGAMVAAAESDPGSAFFQPEVTVIDSDGKPVVGPADRVKAWLAPAAPALLEGEELAASLLRGNWMYFPSVVFRTEVLRRHGFREGLDIVLDLDLYLRMLLDGERLALVPGRLFRYRRHEESLSSAERFSGGRFAEEAAFFAEADEALRSRGWTAAARQARLHATSRLHALMLLPRAVAAHDRALARVLLRHALETRPGGTAGASGAVPPARATAGTNQ